VREVKSGNLSEEDYAVSEEQLVTRNGHRGGVIWLTGLSGSGKSTLAHALHERLFAKGCQVTVLDGDNVRRGLCSDLGFSPEDRSENIRRIGEVAALFAEAGMIVVTAFISPYAEDRKRARTAAGDKFHTVYVKADVTTCESRDVKGLYAKARAGEIQEFTGVSAPYEEPEHPDLVVDTAELSVQEAVELLQDYIKRNLLV
jgi:bifunctional enzyme CysN/CysC